MTISVNNKAIEVPAPLNVAAILKQLCFEQGKGIAVAINNEVVPKSHWESHLINDNDRITIIRATQGG